MISARVSVWRSSIEQDLDSLLSFLTVRIRSELQGLHVEAITYRKKSASSIQQKLQSGKVKSIHDIRDLAGMTVVLLYRSEISHAIDILKQTDLEIDDPGPMEVAPSDFKYHEPKVFIRPPHGFLSRNTLKVDECEVQFTTALQHALDAATHDFDYKGRSYSWNNFRLVARMRGVLEMIDRTIDNIDSSSLLPDATVKAPEEILSAEKLLRALESHFAGYLPDDRRRLADTVLGWLTASGLGVEELDSALSTNADLVSAKSIDATSATLGALLREHPDLLSSYTGHVYVSSELRTLCDAVSELPEHLLVDELS